MATKTSFIFLITLLSTLLTLSSSITPPFTKLYAFGDSYTDTGNTKTSTGPSAFNHVSNPPYGVTFFHRPTNRYSDGRIVIDFVTQALKLPFLPPYCSPKPHGVNFAVGGATAIRTGFFVKNNISFNLVPQSLQSQLVKFNKILGRKGCKDTEITPRECGMIFDDALIWLGEIGANDYTCSLGSSISKNTIQALAINSVTGFLQALLNKGAKYIVVQGLPRTGCVTYSFALASPDDRDEMGCVKSMNQIAYTHNIALKAKLNVLTKKYPQSVIVYADYYNAHLEVMKNAKKYGFKELYKACCGYGGGKYNFDVFNTCGSPLSSSCDNPSEYINWDGAHLTEAVYKVMTNLFLNGSYCNPPFRYLLNKKRQSGSHE